MSFSSFTYQFLKKNPKEPLREKSQNVATKVKLLNGQNFFNNKSKNLKNIVCLQYPLCIIKFSFQAILGQKKLPDFSNFGPKFFAPKSAKMKILLCKGGIVSKLYLMKFFYLLLKKFRPFSNFTFKSNVL